MPFESISAALARLSPVRNIQRSFDTVRALTRLPTLPVYRSPLADLKLGLDFWRAAEKPALAQMTNPEIASALRSARVEVPAGRELTDWEIKRLAQQIAPPAVKPRRQRRGAANVAAVEVEAKVLEAERGELRQLLRRRPVAELPTARALRAQHLLQTIGRGHYRSTKTVSIVEEMIRAVDELEFCQSFPEEKRRLRVWLKTRWALTKGAKSNSKRKNRGQVPQLSTFDKLVNSLEPIYQVLLKELHSKLALNSEVPDNVANSRVHPRA